MRLTCGKCDNGWICEEQPDLSVPHDDCGGPGVPCENPACDFSIIALVWSARAVIAHKARSKRRRIV